MKKLLLILSAVFVSVMGLAQATMNPYAYDLQSTWNEETRKLTLSFKTNTKPNLNPTDKSYGPEGIMVKLVSLDGTKTYKAIPVRRADITGCGPYQYVIDFSTYQNPYGDNTFDGIPGGEWFTWQVDVAGQSNDQSNYPDGRTKPAVTCWNAAYRPVSTHGVAVSKGYNSTDFGRIYATVFNGNTEDIIQNRYTWLKNKTPSVIKYEPMDLATDGKIPTTYTASRFQASNDPHRVRVSDDGRMFVSSLRAGDASVVWECTSGTYEVIIKRKANNGTIVAMDVKGSGENLKLLLCEMIVNYSTYSDQGNSKQQHARLIIREYNIGRSTTVRYIEDSDREIYYNDYRTDANKAGMIYQGYTGNWQSVKTEGMISIAYGKNNSIWLKMDFGSGSNKPRVVYFDGTNNCANYYDTGSSTYSGMKGTSLPNAYGGSGILVFDDNLITAYPDYVSFYKYDESGILTKRYSDLNTISGTFRGIADWVNDLAVDPANNVYAVSSDAMNLMVISLPYSGITTTNAADKYKFQIPYPASNLTYAPVDGKNQYKFTFKVDATPRTVDVRFYTTKEQMLKGGNDYAFHYSAFKTAIKGTMSVTFDAVNGTITNKELEDTDENKNGILNLPPGEYYWCVCVNGTATPASDSYCFVPERISQDMDAYAMNDIINPDRILKDIAIYRPMKSSYYNTFCLPFDVDFSALDDGHPYKVEEGGATLLEFVGIQLTTFNGETMLELQFNKVSNLKANLPYLFKPKEDVNLIMSLNKSLTILEDYKDVNDDSHKIHKTDDQGNGVLYWAFLPKRDIGIEAGDICLVLVDQNRLAQVSSSGTMLGLRGIFVLDKPLPAGTQVGIAERKPTPTSIIDLNGTEVDVEKFMREGRVYIRVGESLYSLSGERVE